MACDAMRCNAGAMQCSECQIAEYTLIDLICLICLIRMLDKTDRRVAPRRFDEMQKEGKGKKEDMGRSKSRERHVAGESGKTLLQQVRSHVQIFFGTSLRLHPPPTPHTPSPPHHRLPILPLLPVLYASSSLYDIEIRHTIRYASRIPASYPSQDGRNIIYPCHASMHPFSNSFLAHG